MCLGVPGQLVAIDSSAALPTGTVDVGGARREVCLSCVPEAAVGDYVLIHVGFALAVIDEADAAATWALLEQITLDP